ncbi:MAG: hypothetical protein OEZ15_06505, partial [Gammaproteobacteria bacterium]|nr:hypothetical protein [Gammaproteobacteria bacterium]
MASVSSDNLNRGIRSSIVLVVGMHRSGTSVLMRGLKTLGIEIGEEFHDPAADNAKGFWEDKDVLALNEKILRSLGCRWDSIRPVPLASLQGEMFQALRKQAREILRKKKGNTEFWGIKDPRFSRLLPFWIPIFEEAGAQTYLVMSIRHPVSIARSLAVRDQISEEKSSLLCLSHWIDVLQSNYADKLIVIDYDDFVTKSEAKLTDIAGRLNINVTSEIKKSISDFSNDFVSESLRHNIVTERESLDWSERGGCFSLVISLYKQLLKLSEGKISLQDSCWGEIYNEFRLLIPMFSYIDALSDASHGRVHDLEYQMGLRDQEIVRLNNVVEQSSADIKKLYGELSERVSQLGEKENKIAVLNETQKGLNQQLLAMQQREGELGQQLAVLQQKEDELHQQLAAKQQREDELNQQIVIMQQREGELNQQLEVVQQRENMLDQQLEASQLRAEELSQQLQALQTRESQLLEVSRTRETELVQQLDAAKERETRLAHTLEQTQQYHNSLLSYQTGIKKMLDQERLTILKPILRRLYKLAISISSLLPVRLQGLLKRMRKRLIKRPLMAQIPAWEIPSA